MHRLSFAIAFFIGLVQLPAQSPHGEDFRMACEKCHNPSGWSIDFNALQFDHDKTEFSLEGTHELVDCTMCHQDLSFKGAPMECASCHTDVHSQSVGDDCIRCHDSETWLVSNIPELHEANGFPLVGPHNNLSCVECHSSETNLRFDRLGNECISCHQDDYIATQTPNHQQAGYSTDCIECHNPLGYGWDAESINHDFFPLAQGHDIQDCTECHTTGNYADASPECIACHQEDYAATQEPNHQASGFSTDCATCHTTNPGWRPATINHDFFPLTQGHDIQDCARCHSNGTYTGLSPDCVACHQSDYNQTSDPNHLAANFPTDCAACHTTNPGWQPAEFNHDGQFFPIDSGPHREAWNACTDCHTNPGNYSEFSCFQCHGKTQTDSDHDEVNDYLYESMACLQCHPDGRS